MEEFAKRYHAYFQRHEARRPGPRAELDRAPRVVLVPGLGLFGAGRNARDAGIAADIAESTVETVTDAEAVGTFESAAEADLFDVEYWSLEQAKLGKSAGGPFAGCVVVVTGGSGAIGAATAEAFAREGAEIAVLDVDEDAARETCRRIGGAALPVRCDVTDAGSVREAFDAVCERFGGVDLVVSNAGAAWQGRIGDVSDDLLRKSFELNFFAHQTVAQNAVRVMRAQGTGGALLFNVSKQAINPGRDFGPYGLPKAATLFLVRQYALDHGSEGIRANAVNADRVRSGLLTPEMVASRAKARGMTEADYMSGNLLGKEVTPEDVAQAFVHQALEAKTTADVTTVDGGNIAAILR
jgi:NAD(P)-dependent dehydrogenase (short-subunit alcohol dehydrogenase family)